MREIHFRVERVSRKDMSRAAGILAPDDNLRRTLVRQSDGSYILTDYDPSSTAKTLIADIRSCLLRFPHAQLDIVSQIVEPEYA